MRNFLTLLFFHLSIICVAQTMPYQPAIVFNDKHNLSLSSGFFMPASKGSIHYYCPSQEPYFRFLKDPWPVDVYTFNGSKMYSSSSPVWAFSAMFPEPYYVVVNKTDTVVYLTPVKREIFKIKALDFSTEFLSRFNVNGDTILICSADYSPIYLSDAMSVITENEFCSGGYLSAYNYSNVKYYVNGQMYPSSSLYENSLKNNDTLQVEVNNLFSEERFSGNCDCSEKVESLKSRKYIIRKGAIGKYFFPEKTLGICPGDTVDPFDGLPYFSRLTYKTIDAMSFQYQNKAIQNNTFTKPVVIMGYVYEQGLGQCWSITDTLSYELGANCAEVLSNEHDQIKQEIQVYPNPSKSTLNLTETSDVTIESLTGEMLLKANDVNSVNISSFNNGLYLLKTSQGQVVKIIVE